VFGSGSLLLQILPRRIDDRYHFPSLTADKDAGHAYMFVSQNVAFVHSIENRLLDRDASLRVVRARSPVFFAERRRTLQSRV
jgi:hypothetical protein